MGRDHLMAHAFILGSTASNIVVSSSWTHQVSTFGLFRVRIEFLGRELTLLLPITVLASLADAYIGAGDSALVAFTVLFLAAGLLAVAALGMEALLFDLGLESVGVPVDDGVDGLLPFFVVFNVGAVVAVALGTAAETVGETVAVELQTFGLLAVADAFAVCALILGVGDYERGFDVGRGTATCEDGGSVAGEDGVAFGGLEDGVGGHHVVAAAHVVHKHLLLLHVTVHLLSLHVRLLVASADPHLLLIRVVQALDHIGA